ncbi:MAG: hypothetical protein LUI12_14235 [Clostridiales bacterium]|nr:hypothetical protein [Clostridiales bacterium]
MRKLWKSRGMIGKNCIKKDNRGSAIVIVIIAMALIGILATTILWSAYLNYRIKINDMKVKNSFYSAETVVEQIVAGVKKDVASRSINIAYQEVLSNWDALGTEANRKSYFVTAYIASVEEQLNVSQSGTSDCYDKSVLEAFVDQEFWSEGNAGGYIVNQTWNDADPLFQRASSSNGYSMVLKNICVEFYDSNGYLSVINTDIAIDVPSLRFTQAGAIDRLYPYALIGGQGIEFADNQTVTVEGSIYGGAGEDDEDDGGIQLSPGARVTVTDASYVISGADIVVGNNSHFVSLLHQDASLIVENRIQNGVGYRTSIYARGLAVNGSHVDVSGKMYIANDLILSGKGSSVSLAGRYYGYGNTNTALRSEEVETEDEDGNTVTQEQNLNPADSSSAILINGKDSTVDLLGLTVLELAGRAYVGLSQEEDTDNGLPHVLMGESISVKSNQIAYLVPAECVGTLDGETVIGQNPVSFSTWLEMLENLSEYQEKGQDFRLVNASKEAARLGYEKLSAYGIGDIDLDSLSGIDTSDAAAAVTKLNQAAQSCGIRFYYESGTSGREGQVYLYLLLDDQHAEEYFAQYYNVNSNKASLDAYFNQYASGGIKIKDNVSYTVVGNSMVSVLDAAASDSVAVSSEGANLVRLLSELTQDAEEETENADSQTEEGTYQEISDNVETVVNATTQEALEEMSADSALCYENLLLNLQEDDGGTEKTVFENLIRLNTQTTDSESVTGLQDYLDEQGGSDGKVEFTATDGLKAVFVDCSKQSGDTYRVTDSDLRLVVAIGDVEVQKNFQGLIIASGKITVADSVTIAKDAEGVYDVLQAESEIEGDSNVPANVFYNGSGMLKNGYEETDVDEYGNLNIDYSKIVRYENWIKK